MNHTEWQALMFQQLADCESRAREQELLSALAAHHATPDEIEGMRLPLIKTATRNGKTPAAARIWADDVLRRLVRFLDQG